MRGYLIATFLLAVVHSSIQHDIFAGRRVLMTERILIGTVQSLSGNGVDTSRLLAGYNLWVERTNMQGGIKLGNSSLEVELKVMDCGGDVVKQAEMYRNLVQVNQVDFLLGGGPGSAKAMFNAAEPNQILSLSSLDDGEWGQFATSSFMYAVHPKNVQSPTMHFVESSRQNWGLKRMAAIWVASSPTAVSECQIMLATIQAQSLDVDVVLQESIEGDELADYARVLQRVQDSGADFLVSCVETTAQAERIVEAARFHLMLKGWDGTPDEHCGRIVVPAVVESDGLKLMYYTAGVATDEFFETLDGWAQKAVGPAVWHHDVQHIDPFFGSSTAVNDLWQSRRDLGDGVPMCADTASGLAAGVALRLAVEQAGSIEGAAVAAAMQSLDQETFFGRVRFAADGSNEGLEMPLVQWDCSSLFSCERVVTARQDTSPDTTAFTQPFHPSCPENYLWSDKDATASLVYAPTATGALPESYTNPGCVRCMQGNMTAIKKLRGGEVSWDTFTRTCKEFSSWYRFGVALMAGPGDAEANLGVVGGLNTVQQNFVGLSLMQLAPVLTDPGVGGTTWSESSKETARRDLEATLSLVEQAKPLGWLIWNNGLTKQLGIAPLGDVCPGEGPQIKWGSRAICMAPAPRIQGRAVAQLVEHFGWTRCHVVVSRGLVYTQMLAEFNAMALRRRFDVVQTIEVPGQGEDRDEAVEKVASLNDCDASIVVMLVERDAAEDIFAIVYGGDSPAWGGSKQFVVVGAEASTRAINAPRGMLGVRTVGVPDSPWTQGAAQGSARTFGTGVYEPVEDRRRRSGSGLWGIASDVNEDVAWDGAVGERRSDLNGQDAMEVLSPWLDIAVEDRRLFASDAALVIAVAAWTLLEGEQGVDVAAPSEVERGVLGMNALGLGGATGLLMFEVSGDNTTESPRVIERIGGRMAFVNRRAEGWASIAKLDLEGTGSEPIIHTLNATLGQRAWEEEAIEYGAAHGRDSLKPADVCACVIWKKMGPHSNFSECDWSTEAIIVVAFAAAALIGMAIGVWCARRKRVEWQELVVTRRMKELRQRLKLRKRDGFVLSNEARGINVFGTEGRVVQRKQLEALARMTLLYEFEVRALDSLAWTLFSPSEGREELLDSKTPTSHTVSTVRFDEQYRQLRNVLLETSKMLLDPSLDPDQVADTVGRDPATWRPGYYKKQQKREASKLQRGMSLKREIVGHVVFQAEHSNHQERPPSTSTEGGFEKGDVEGNAETVDRKARGHRSSQEKIDEDVPNTIEERFNFFSKHVAQVQVWHEDHHSLFLELKSGAVQDFMDTLRHACDELFQVMLREPNGQNLVSFQYPVPGAMPPAPPKRNSLLPRGNNHPNFNLDSTEPRGASDPHTNHPRRSFTLQSPPDTPMNDPQTPSANPSPPPRAPPRLSLSNVPPSTVVMSPTSAVPGSIGATILPVVSGTATHTGEDDLPMPVGEEELAMIETPDSARHSFLKPPMSRGSVASVDDAHIVIRRQDHPRVRAIRLNEEDWREVDLERTASYKNFSDAQLSANGLTEVVRPVKDEEVYISQLYRRAVLLNDEFQVRVRKAVERRFGRRVEAHGAPVKTKMRMREKLLCYAAETAEHEDPTDALPLAAYILDPIRATVVCDGPSEMLEVADWLVSEGLEEGLPVVRVKNKFAVQDASEYDGYRDLMICVLYTGSHDLSIIGEIQIHDRRLHNLKVQMHKLYKVKRATKATAI